MSTPSRSVLIVDDEPPARARLRQLLEDIGDWQIAGEAGHGRQALELCQSLNPDVVLLDIRMPQMDGIEVARHLTTLERAPAVIFTTAYSDYAIQAFEAQAIGYLVKPPRARADGAPISACARPRGCGWCRSATSSTSRPTRNT